MTNRSGPLDRSRATRTSTVVPGHGAAVGPARRSRRPLPRWGCPAGRADRAPARAVGAAGRERRSSVLLVRTRAQGAEQSLTNTFAEHIGLQYHHIGPVAGKPVGGGFRPIQ